MRRKVVLVVVLTLAALLGFGWAVYSSCRIPFEMRWEKIQVGMSREEVRLLLGEPTQVYPADSFLAALVFDSFQEKWAYGRRRLLESHPSFPFVDLAMDGLFRPEDNDHVVYFSKDGRVVKKCFPYR